MSRLAIVCSLVAGVLAVKAGGQQVPVFRGATDFVPVFVTVTDRDSRLVTALGRDDFRLLDNGREQPLTLFDNSPQPVRLVVMLDVSGSMFGNLPLLRASAEQLFTRLGSEDEARVGVFGKGVSISPTFTRDEAVLTAAVPTAGDPDAPTPLWSALDQALDTFKGVQGRRVVLVLSDGKDTGPAKFGQRFVTAIEIIDRAQREEVMVYGVGLRSRSARPPMPGRFGTGLSLVDDMPDPGLGTLALETGGGYFEIRPSDDLGATFARVVDELHSQYLLGFAPPARDGKRHRIEVRLNARDLNPRARKNYQAPKGS